ncbi:MAG TPA: peptidoglycan DD-metalloendopeptidase family protein [Blastocatellia bacterium]|nr:peptidoglycan DD-metalloendopeptidase family protein [Blastocatellia bacterium]
MRAIIFALVLFCITHALACTSAGNSRFSAPATPRTSGNMFDDYLHTEYAPADGFDFPFGTPDGKGDYTDKATGKQYSGWYTATKFNEQYSLGIHPGEDWNGNGGKNTDRGQDVYAIANGRVVFAESCGRLWGNVIVIEHTFYENFERKTIQSVYAHLLDIQVRAGDSVKRRQLIAHIGQDPDKTYDAHLHLELRSDLTLAPNYWPSSNGNDQAWVRGHYIEPSSFIAAHRKLFVPHNEATLVLVDQASYKMRLYKQAQLISEHDVSFGQEKGQKRVQGDNKTPKGMYFVTNKHRGAFDGAYGAYYGGHWIKVNYPNPYDAARGQAERIISAEQAARIKASWLNRAPTLENTKLGGGIGFHGWIKEWDNDGPRHLSWGCVVMHIFDITKLFDHIPPGTMVVIF